jgi:hypothetical protein
MDAGCGMKEGWAWRIAVVAGGCAGVLLFAFFYGAHAHLYFAILRGWGLDPFRFPFLDSHAVTSSLECARRGFDPYLHNPCDVLTRAFVYSPMILDAAFLPVTVAWTNALGLGLALLLILSLASLPAPRGAREWGVMALAALSTMTLYAVERGNIDILVFAVVTLAGHLLWRGRMARAGGYGLLLVGAALKYYPVVGLILALRESPRRFALAVAASLAILALFAVHYRHGLAEAMALVPYGSYYTDFFGAVNLPFGMARLLSPIRTEIPGAAPVLTAFPWVVLALLLVSCLRQAIAFAVAVPMPSRNPEPAAIFLVLAAALIVGCFFAGQSIGYRGIFFLLALPGLLALGRGRDGQRFRATAVMILFLMWGEMFREALEHLTFANAEAARALQTGRVAFWFVRELIWWRVIAALGGIVLSFAVHSEMARWLGLRLGVAGTGGTADAADSGH